MENLLDFDRSFLNNLVDHLEKIDLKSLDNKGLGLLLIDVQNYVLGELYSVNLVQIEQAITYALEELLKKHEDQENKRFEVLSSIIATKELTEAQKEEIDFLDIILYGKKIQVEDAQGHETLNFKIKEHFNKYAHMHCAYGELPHDISFYYKKYISLVNEELFDKEKLMKEMNQKFDNGQVVLKHLNDKKISVLADIMSRVGVFRDYNKARLGQTVKYRLQIMQEIVDRGLEEENYLKYYLLSEILALLDEGKKINSDEIKQRIEHGVTITRSEYLDLGVEELNFGNEGSEMKLSGVCASPGIIQGECKIVFSKKDMPKINKGDVMIAIGTDFDLMDAIQRSSAVITEEGGLLSHAAVVCREMGKPCCIGVHNATKILKDGVEIKLDAAKGTIDIINEN